MQGTLLKAAVGQAAEPLMNQVRSASNSIAGSHAGGEEEEKEPEPPSIADMIKNPFENCCLIVFLAGAIFGIISLVCFFIGWTSVDFYTSIVLAVVGLTATVEIRNIVRFRIQLQHLEAVKNDLKDATKDLEKELGILDEQNKQLGGEIGELQESVDKISSENEELDQTVREITQTVDMYENNNKELESSVSTFKESNQKLGERCVELRENSDSLRNEVNALETFKTNLAAHAEGQSEELLKVMGKVNEMVDQLAQTVKDQESALLNNIQTSMSFLDDDDEMSEQEYRLFVERMPLKYKEILELNDMGFEKWAGNDKKMNVDEATQMINFLLEYEKNE